MKIISLPPFHLLNDKDYLKLRFRFATGKKLNLKDPAGFSEKIQWLKLNNKDARLPDLVDKIKAKDYVIQKIGAEYVSKTLCVWDDAEKIDTSDLPDKCVLKCNHDSGSTLIFEKENKDDGYIKSFFDKRLNANYFFAGREWPYKSIVPKVFAEEYLPLSNDSYDLKFFCFCGTPKVAVRYGKKGKGEMSYYDMSWKRYDCYQSRNPVSPDFPMPECFESLKKSAMALASDFPFVRVDFVVDKDKYWFSEMTFFPSSGFSPICPEEAEKTFGSFIDIKKQVKE